MEDTRAPEAMFAISNFNKIWMTDFPVKSGFYFYMHTHMQALTIFLRFPARDRIKNNIP